MDSRTLEIVLISQHQNIFLFVWFFFDTDCLFVCFHWMTVCPPSPPPGCQYSHRLSPQEYRAGLRHWDLPAWRRGQSLYRRLSRQLQPGRVRDGPEAPCLPLHHHLLSPLGALRGRLLDIFPRPPGCYSWWVITTAQHWMPMRCGGRHWLSLMIAMQ